MRCTICRREIEPGTGTQMQAFGKPVVTVHREQCAAVVHAGVRTLGKMAATGTELLIKTRAPRVHMLLQGVRAVLRGEVPQ